MEIHHNMPRKTVAFADGSTAEYDKGGFQLLYKGKAFVNSTHLDEPMSFAPKAETTAEGIRIGEVHLRPARTICFKINDGTTATYVEGALKLHHGGDVYVWYDCDEDKYPMLSIDEHDSNGHFEDEDGGGRVLKIETDIGRHLSMYTLRPLMGR